MINVFKRNSDVNGNIYFNNKNKNNISWLRISTTHTMQIVFIAPDKEYFKTLIKQHKNHHIYVNTTSIL